MNISSHFGAHRRLQAALLATAAIIAPVPALAQTVVATTVDELVVTGSIIDQNQRALNQQRAASNTVDVVSSDAIGRFPDPNVAEALQRLPGIGVERDQGEGRYINVRGAPSEFSAVTVNGVSLPSQEATTRAVSLDTLPADLVSRIEISKTLRPDQEADSISGAINLVTRSPFDGNGRRLISGMAGASNNDFGGHDQRFVLTVSDLFGPDRTFGAVLSASYSRTDRKPENIETGWARLNRPEGGQIFGVAENLFKDYDTQRDRVSIAGAFEWRPDDATQVYLRGNVAKYEDDEIRNLLRILYTDGGTLRPGSTNTSATFAKTRIEKQIRHRVQRNDVRTIEAGGSRDFGGFEADMSVAYTTSEQTYPHRDELLWRSSLRPTINYDYANPDAPVISLFDTREHLTASSYAFRENTFRGNDTDQEAVQARANVAFNSSLLGVPAAWRFGLSHREVDVVADEERWRDRAAGSAPTGGLADYLTDEESINYGYLLGFKQDRDKVLSYFEAQRALQSTATRRLEQSITADYAALEKISGVYGMATLDLGATSVVAGVRVEKSEFEGVANRFNANTSAITETTNTIEDTQAFPSLTVRHEFTDRLIGRAALTRGINRPNYVDLVPRITEDQDGAVLRVDQGNPDLQPTLSDNLDFGLNYFIPNFGVIGGNLFYKKLTDYRYNLTLAGTYNNLPAQITRPENAPDGDIFGFELDWRQQFDFLPGFASNFGVLANATFTNAEIELGRTYAGRSKFALPGHSARTYNAAVFYDDGALNARLSYTHRTAFLDEINADDAGLDLYWAGRGQLDFTASYAFAGGKYETFVEAKNLSNSAGVRYYGSRERTYEYEKFGSSIFLGVRFRL